jgi:hypothetical protein
MTTSFYLIFWIDKFKDNIFFVTVSKKPRLDLIIQHLYRHKGSQVPSNFHNEVNAVQWLQTFLKEEGKKPVLLVLDDVWSGSESLLDKFQCRMTMYKILVTSRSEFPAFSSPYHLPLLGYEDGTKLFHHAASLGDKSSNIPPHLSKKVLIHELHLSTITYQQVKRIKSSIFADLHEIGHILR